MDTKHRDQILNDMHRAKKLVQDWLPCVSDQSIVIAGGCVRDWLLDLPPKDIDIFVDYRCIDRPLFNLERYMRQKTNGQVQDLCVIDAKKMRNYAYSGIGELKTLYQVFEFKTEETSIPMNIMVTGFPDKTPFTPLNVVETFDNSLAMACWDFETNTPRVYPTFETAFDDGNQIVMFSTSGKSQQRYRNVTDKLRQNGINLPFQQITSGKNRTEWLMEKLKISSPALVESRLTHTPLTKTDGATAFAEVVAKTSLPTEWQWVRSTTADGWHLTIDIEASNQFPTLDTLHFEA